MELNYSLHKVLGYGRKVLGLDKLSVYDWREHAPADQWCVQASGHVTYGNASFNLEHPVLSGTFYFPQLHLYRLRNAYLVGRNGLVYHENGSLFTVPENIPDIRFHKLFPPVKGLAQKVKSPVCSLVGPVYENRAHFLREKLPKAIVAQRLLGRDLKFLISRGHSWQYQYLAYAGIQPERIIEVGKGATWCAELYTIPQYHTLFAPEVYAEIRKTFLDKIDCIDDGPALLISREDAPDRRILNEDVLLDILRQKYPNALKINLSKVPLEEQLKYFRSAPFIIGCHGQAFHLNLFTEAARIVQFSPGVEDQANPYWDWGNHFIYWAALAGSSCAHIFANQGVGLHDDFAFSGKVFESLLFSAQWRNE